MRKKFSEKNFSREWKIAWKKLIFPNSDVSFLILADSDRDSDRKSRFLDRDWKEKETSKASKLKAKIKSERSGGDSGWGTPNSRYKGLTWMTFCSYRTLICAIEKFSTRKWFFAPIFTCTPIFWHKSLSARNLDQFRAEWFLCRKKNPVKTFSTRKPDIGADPAFSTRKNFDWLCRTHATHQQSISLYISLHKSHLVLIRHWLKFQDRKKL